MGIPDRQQLFTEADYLNWHPLSLDSMLALMKEYRGPWCFAGGYALELFLGYAYRTHGDIDLLFPRQDQNELRQYFKEWELYMGTRPGLAFWDHGQPLQDHIYDIWAREEKGAPWRFQIMLLDTIEDRWIYKRDPKIQGQMQEAMVFTSAKVPFLAPEIQLLYKAKLPFREKDQLDFEKVLPALSENQKAWLLSHLIDQYTQNHPWVSVLSNR